MKLTIDYQPTEWIYKGGEWVCLHENYYITDDADAFAPYASNRERFTTSVYAECPQCRAIGKLEEWENEDGMHIEINWGKGE